MKEFKVLGIEVRVSQSVAPGMMMVIPTRKRRELAEDWEKRWYLTVAPRAESAKPKQNTSAKRNKTA